MPAIASDVFQYFSDVALGAFENLRRQPLSNGKDSGQVATAVLQLRGRDNLPQHLLLDAFGNAAGHRQPAAQSFAAVALSALGGRSTCRPSRFGATKQFVAHHSA